MRPNTQHLLKEYTATHAATVEELQHTLEPFLQRFDKIIREAAEVQHLRLENDHLTAGDFTIARDAYSYHIKCDGKRGNVFGWSFRNGKLSAHLDIADFTCFCSLCETMLALEADTKQRKEKQQLEEIELIKRQLSELRARLILVRDLRVEMGIPQTEAEITAEFPTKASASKVRPVAWVGCEAHDEDEHFDAKKKDGANAEIFIRESMICPDEEPSVCVSFYIGFEIYSPSDTNAVTRAICGLDSAKLIAPFAASIGAKVEALEVAR